MAIIIIVNYFSAEPSLESDVYGNHQILTSKDGPRAERVERLSCWIPLTIYRIAHILVCEYVLED